MLKDIGQLLIEKKSFFVQLTIEHLEISLLAILIAIVLGGVIGILISEFAKTTKPTMAAINFIYTIPSISMLGFLIPFSGIGNTTSVIALTIYALLPMVRNTYTGLVNVDKNIIEAARGFRVIIVTVANSLGNIRVFELLPKLKTKKYGWCIA